MTRRAARHAAVARGLRAPQSLAAAVRGYRYAASLGAPAPAPAPAPALAGPEPAGALEQYFDAHTEGPGIWKWRHYFEVYERHLAKFVGRDAHFVEVGVFAGGSLAMWRSYLGPGSRIYGVDLHPSCLAHADPDAGIRVILGDQASGAFWAGFRAEVPRVDVVLDDGGHEPHQQIATLEALLPHMSPGGVYLCEDVHGAFQPFHSYVDALSRRLHEVGGPPLGLHEHVKSVHSYPGIIVIEKPSARPAPFEAPQRGDDWRPFW